VTLLVLHILIASRKRKLLLLLNVLKPRITNGL